MTDRYAVVGNPINHSRSPEIHARFARESGVDLTYERIEAPLDGFRAVIDRFRAEGGRGLNVTVPFKVEAFELSDTLSRRAQVAGAVNTLRFDDDGISAENTDGLGLVTDIVENLGVSIEGARVLVLGAGGAVRGSILPILDQSPTSVTICNRTPGRAEGIVRAIGAEGTIPTPSPADLPPGPWDVIINATSASLFGEMPEISRETLTGSVLAYEMAYGKGRTPFLALAQGAGATTVADGVGMLVEQAAQSFYFWTGVRPDTAGLIADMAVPLAAAD